jgi:putative RNA 2'-phosphotransferase
MPFQRDRVKVSKFLSYILRHDPDKYGLRPDKYGFVNITEILDALKQRFRAFRDEELFDVLDNDPKGRFEITGKTIRATYGHSIEVLPFSGEEEPPEVLFHGTSREGAERILKEGLKPMDRKFAHLSINENDARAVGSRHDENPVILKIMAGEASRDGIKFYREANVFLAEQVPAKYVVMSDE